MEKTKMTGIFFIPQTSNSTKETLTKLAEEYNYTLLYIVAEEESPFIECDTFNIPTDSEMKEHLNWN